MPSSLTNSGGLARFSGNQESLDSANGRNFAVVSMQQFESGPPVSKVGQDEDGEVFETVKEEEWVTKRKKTTLTTKNIEKRVQRELLLEDGEVVRDSGPVVTEDATEDTVVHETSANEGKPYNEDSPPMPPGDGWVAVPGALVVSEKVSSTVNSHQVSEDARETEETTHCGEVSNKEVDDHLAGRADVRAICEAREKAAVAAGGSKALAHYKPKKRVVNESARKWGHVDTNDVRETSRIKDGHVVTETERTTQHEKYENESLPDSGSTLSDGSVHEEVRDTKHNISHTKDEDFVEYYAVPKGGTLAQGVKLGEGMHVVSEDFHEDRLGEDLDSLSERAKKNRLLQHHRTKRGTSQERTDALTRRPLDYVKEEETRKSETNKWLLHHFGSESTRSRDSSLHDLDNDDEDKVGHTSSGGNIITITMSPRPATPEDTVDASPPGPLRRWGGTSPLSSTPKAPPPPPFKSTTVFGMPQTTTKYLSQDGLDERMVDARSKLKRTGRGLGDLNESDSNEYSSSTLASNPRYAGIPERVQVLPTGPRGTFTSPPLSPLSPTSSIKNNDPVYSSRFRSGTPDMPESPPPPLPSSEPPSFVGRSQSFNVASRPWHQSTPISYNSLHIEKRPMLKKGYQSEDRLDMIDKPTSGRPLQLWPPPPREPSPDEPQRGHSPPSRTSRRSSPHKGIAPSPPFFHAHEAATQTGPTPVPPPRTKRKNKPSKSYFFGEVSPTPTSNRSNVFFINGANTLSTGRSVSSDSNRRSSKKEKTSPKVERRFKTTKTITPVVVMEPSVLRRQQEQREKEEKKQQDARRARHYRSMDQLNDAPKSSWTNTVDPRRRRRLFADNDDTRPTTLPRKISNANDSSPRKTYFFGEPEPSNNRYKGKINTIHGGSMINVSSGGTNSRISSDYRNTHNFSENTKLRNTIRPVARSHSFNVQPETPPPDFLRNIPLSESTSEKKSSTIYRSSPYLNLRSPNLIANIARSSSIKQSNDIQLNGNERHVYSEKLSKSAEDEEDPKRDEFLKGLLNAAPELYHYIHGEGTKGTNPSAKKSTDEVDSSVPPRLIRPPVLTQTTSNGPLSPVSPTQLSTPRYFTFGRGESDSLKKENNVTNKHNTITSLNSLNRANKSSLFESKTHDSSRNNSNRRSAFNLKASKGSLLFSPSFRSNQDNIPPWERRESDENTNVNEEWVGKSDRVTSSLQRDGPVLIQVRDWNTR